MIKTINTAAGGDMQQKQVKEDFADIIYNLSPTKTPMLSLAKRSATKSIEVGWFLDKLTDAVVSTGNDEGGTPVDGVIEQVKRQMNVTQIFSKKVSVSGTAESVDWYGRASEMAYQMTKKAQELKRDIEVTLCAKSQAPVGGYTDNLATASYPTAPTTGSKRTMSNYKWQIANNPLGGTTVYNNPQGGGPPLVNQKVNENTLTGAMQMMWLKGGEPSMALCTGPISTQIAALALTGTGAGLSARYRDAGEGTKLVNVVDMYVTPFGELSVAISRFLNSGETGDAVNDIFLIDPEYIDICYLRQPKTDQIAKTGDFDDRMIITELTFKVLAPDGVGLITDIAS